MLFLLLLLLLLLLLGPFHSNLSPILRGRCWGSEGDGDQEEKTEGFLLREKKLKDWNLDRIELDSYFQVVLLGLSWDENLKTIWDIFNDFGSAGRCDVS